MPSTPCSTSTACGGLDEAFTNDKLDPKTPNYSYCSADDSGMTDEIVSECMSCVGALDGQKYLANCKVPPSSPLYLITNDRYSPHRS